MDQFAQFLGGVPDEEENEAENKGPEVEEGELAEDEDLSLDDLLADAKAQNISAQALFEGQSGPSATPIDETKENDDDINPNEAEEKTYVFDLLREENCIHEVAVPRNKEYVPLKIRETPPAKTYPFKLDPFQSEAIKCVDNYQSVLVSAHTSAGKTAIALYAVALALREKQRVIYTSPIKALSNQKYRELYEEFEDVGLMTGDVTLNPEASCLVMTTEILRSMLYRGSEIAREVGWVIFDEIHYMRDEERGVVWEEAIILQPDSVHYVFLSATIPNAKEFAAWIANLHNQSCHVVYTDYRPTPLQHVFYSSGSNGLYEVVSTQGEFREEQFMKAMSFVSDKGDGGGGERRGGGGNRRGRDAAAQQGASGVLALIRTVQERSLMPCIVFSFSRKDCESYAAALKDVDFNSEDKKAMISEIYENAVTLLSEEDQKLPQIKWLLPFLLRGIGIHHSGLLPLLKECVEILFGEGLLQVLFATETFAMGLNMPARTVLFTSAQKFDGRERRWITSGEYIQMSGRAGRRGTDSQGLVILMVDQLMSADNAKQIIKGQTDPLNSQFRLTYNMVLNLIRVPDVNPQYMMERSFRYFQNKSLLPPLYTKLKDKKEEYENCVVPHEEELEAYNQMKVISQDLKNKIDLVCLSPRYIAKFLQAGRLLRVKNTRGDLGWGILLEAQKKQNKFYESYHELTMLLSLSWDCVSTLQNYESLLPSGPNEAGAYKTIALDLRNVTEISSIRVKLPDSFENQEKMKESMGMTLKKALNKFNGVPPVLDRMKDMGVTDKKVIQDCAHRAKLEQEIAKHSIKDRNDFQDIYAAYEKKLAVAGEVRSLKDEIRKIKGGQFNEELEARHKILRRMGYVDSYDNITQKGRIACEISAADEILVTEILLTGVFNTMAPADCAALLSCFLFEERTDKMPTLDAQLQDAYNSLLSHARKVAKISIECKMPLIEEKYLEKFQPSMMPAVKMWCSGASFKEVTEEARVFEGSIIRCLRRLEELLRQMHLAVKAMGNEELSNKFEEASKALKRDIVFAASLYL